MPDPTTRKIRYVGPSHRGVVIEEAGGILLRPAASKLAPPTDRQGQPAPVTDVAEVDAALALRLVTLAGFEPVGWKPPKPAPPATDQTSTAERAATDQTSTAQPPPQVRGTTTGGATPSDTQEA